MKGKVERAQFVASEDITRETPDGRTIMVARKGTGISIEEATRLGLIESEAETSEDEPKAKTPANNKSKTPDENK